MELPEHQLLLRNLRPEDYADLRAIMDRVYRGDDMKTPERYFQAQVEMFPQGQICIEDHGTVVAAAFSVVVDYDKFGDSHTYKEITGDLLLTTHDPKGDVLYGIEVLVHPDYQGMRLGRRLYEARKELCRNLNLKSIIAGGRIPGYAQHAGDMTPQDVHALLREAP
jgi:GNAT superfamily N-acetyltransferase